MKEHCEFQARILLKEDVTTVTLTINNEQEETKRV
jgi:hypothetical protein